MFCNKKCNDLINRTHKRALRVVLNDFSLSYKDSLEATCSTTVHVNNLRLLLCEIYKSVHLLNPEFMREMFVHKESMYNLRRGKQLVLPPTKTVFGVNSLIFRGVIAWNHLPKELKEVPKLSIFKKHLNKYDIYCHCKICS